MANELDLETELRKTRTLLREACEVLAEKGILGPRLEAWYARDQRELKRRQKEPVSVNVDSVLKVGMVLTPDHDFFLLGDVAFYAGRDYLLRAIDPAHFPSQYVFKSEIGAYGPRHFMSLVDLLGWRISRGAS